MKKSALLFLSAAFLIGILAALFFSQEQKEKSSQTPPEAAKTVPDIEEKSGPPVRLPVAPPPSEVIDNEEPPPLPSLDKSDTAMRETLTAVLPQSKLLDMFIFDHLIQRFVLMVDSLPRPELSYKHLPLHTTFNRFITQKKGGTITISPENYQRYAPFVELVKMMEMEEATGIYHYYYSLFQEAYRKLGYPNASFNDRFIEVIDHLLSTPVVKPPIRLVQPHIRYQYADPALEALSSGQKLLIRMGLDNSEIILGKLRELRPLLTSPPPENE